MVRYRKTKDGITRQGAVPITDLLARYKTRLRPPQGVVIATFCEIVGEELGITLTRSDVRYSPYTRTVSLSVRGPQKTEIMLQKKRVLDKCKEILGELSFPKHIV